MSWGRRRGCGANAAVYTTGGAPPTSWAAKRRLSYQIDGRQIRRRHRGRTAVLLKRRRPGVKGPIRKGKPMRRTLCVGCDDIGARWMCERGTTACRPPRAARLSPTLKAGLVPLVGHHRRHYVRD